MKSTEDRNDHRRPLRLRLRAGDQIYEALKEATAAAIGLYILVLAAAPAVAAQPIARNPVALVVEEKGRTSPELPPYSEIMSGDAVEIPDASSLVFIDYRSCNRETVSGMNVNFSPSGFSTSRGDKRTEQKVACPQSLAPDSGGDNSSSLMRGIDSGRGFPLVAIRSTFVIVGARPHRFARVRIKDATRTLVDAKLHGTRFDWPPSTPPLEAGSVYHMVLLPERANDSPIKLSFRAAADSPGAPQDIVLIHADR